MPSYWIITPSTSALQNSLIVLSAEGLCFVFADFPSAHSGDEAVACGDADVVGGRVVVVADDDQGRDFAKAVSRLAMDAGATEARIVSVPKHWKKGWDLANTVPDGADTVS